MTQHDYKQLTFLRTNMSGEDEDTHPAEICISDGSGKLHLQKVSNRALLNMARDAIRILAETRFFEKGEKNDR